MLVIPLYLNSIALITLLQEGTGAFDDVGKLLLGGVGAAIVVAVGFTIVRFHVGDKKPETSSFISISSANDKD